MKYLRDLSFVIIGAILATINASINSEIYEYILEHWRIIGLYFSLFLISLGIISFLVRYWFNIEVKNSFTSFIKRDLDKDELLRKHVESFKKDGVLNRVIIRNVLLVNMDKDTMKSVAEELYPIYYSTGVYVDYFSEYKLPKELIQEIQKNTYYKNTRIP